MLTRTAIFALILLARCLGQNEPAKAAAPAESRFFRLDFAVKEVEAGKTINSRNYIMSVSTERDRTSVRSGNKVPIPTGGAGSTNTSFTFVDIGTNIDCWAARESQGQLVMMVSAEVSSAADGQIAASPVIRQVRWNAPVVVTLRKPTVIFSSDDPSSKRQMQLELTATPIQ